jgi:hypothetical protein
MEQVSDAVWQLIAKCVTGESSDEEYLSMQRVMDRNEKIRRVYSEAKVNYQTPPKSIHKDSNAAFEKLKVRIELKTSTSS